MKFMHKPKPGIPVSKLSVGDSFLFGTMVHFIVGNGNAKCFVNMAHSKIVSLTGDPLVQPIEVNATYRKV